MAAKKASAKRREPDVTITLRLYSDRDAEASFEGPVDGKWIERARRMLPRLYRGWRRTHLRDAREEKQALSAEHQAELDIAKIQGGQIDG